jgi:hypothetical protein
VARLWLAALPTLAAASPVVAQTLSQEEALRLAFPAGLSVRRHTAYLEPAELAAARVLAGPDVELTQRVVSYYLAERDGQAEAVAYFDSHRVRTLPEVLMVVVDAAGRVRRVEVLKFAEPPEYRAPGNWLAQLQGKSLGPAPACSGAPPPGGCAQTQNHRRAGPALSVRRDVVNITGATLTAAAVTRATRRVLALHAVIRPFQVRP